MGPGGVGGRVLSGTCVVSSRLAPLHQLLRPMASCARVVQCAEAVPTLLQAFFSAVTQVSPLLSSSVPAGGPALGLGRATVLGADPAVDWREAPGGVPHGRPQQRPIRPRERPGLADTAGSRAECRGGWSQSAG